MPLNQKQKKIRNALIVAFIGALIWFILSGLEYKELSSKYSSGVPLSPPPGFRGPSGFPSVVGPEGPPPGY